MGNPNSKSHFSENDDYVTVKTYNGDTKNGKRHGRGVYMYPNGDMYDGEWRKSRKYGRGVYTYSDGQRLEGFFYRDQYIGKKPNEKIKKRMAKKQKRSGRIDNRFSVTEQTDVSTDAVLDDPSDPGFKLKSEGSSHRRAESLKRNKWIREKYKMDGDTEFETSETRNNKRNEEFKESSKNGKRSFSFGSKRQKNVDFDEAIERRNSKRLRESIRQKYNLKGRERKDLLLSSE